MNTTQEKNKTIKKINSNTTNKNILRLNKNENGITLIALVVTIVLNCSFLAMVVKSWIYIIEEKIASWYNIIM